MVNAKKMKQLEDENRKLKHVVAELTLDNRAALKDVLSKMYGPPRDCEQERVERNSLQKCIRPTCGARLLAMMRIRARRSF